MPRVTDFPDQKQSMMQAVMQNRQLNQQADQTFLTAQMKNEQMNQSMLGMVMGDRLNRDNMAQQQNQFDDNMDLSMDQFTESKRAATEREQMTQEQIDIAKSQLQFNKDVDQREANQAVIDRYGETVQSIAEMEGQLSSYMQKQAEGISLTGAERSNAEALKKQIETQIALGHDILKETGENTGIDEDVLGGMTNVLKLYGESSLSTHDFTQAKGSEAGILTRYEPNPTQKGHEFGSMADFLYNTVDTVTRFVSDETVPPLMTTASKRMNEVIQGQREWDSNMEARLASNIETFAKKGFATYGGVFPDTDALNANKSKHINDMNEFIEQGVMAKIVSDGRSMGLQGQELDNYVSDPVRLASTMEQIMPVEVKQADRAFREIEDLKRAQEYLGQEAFMNMMQGGPGARAQLDQMNLGHLSASRVTKLVNDFQNGEMLFLDPEKEAQMEAGINLLSGYGLISPPEPE